MIIAGVAAAVKADVVGKIAEGVAGLVGPTATDRERVAAANALLSEALQGSATALATLIRQAYEPKPDGKFSPQAVRDLAVKSLRQYVQAAGGLPEQYQKYAPRLNADIIPGKMTAADQVLAVVREGVRGGVAQGTVTTAQDYGRKASPWLIGAAVIVAAVLIYRATK
jgi:hypothetical protein